MPAKEQIKEFRKFMLRNSVKYFFVFCFVTASLAAPCLLRAQQSFSVRTTSRNILIGDQINIWLQYRQSGTVLPQLKWPVLPDSIHGLVWVEKGKIDTLKTKDSVKLLQKLVVTGFDSGNYFIPSFNISITSGNQSPQVISTDSLPVRIQTVQVDTTKDFKPINGVKNLPITWWDYWKQILLAVLGLAAIVLVLLYFIRWKKRKPKEDPKVPPEKAHERALRLLEELKAKKLWQSGEIKSYYDQLSLILREYLQNRFSIPAMECTSDELLKQTHKMSELKPFRKQLRQILQTSDLAKFARANPLPEEHESCMQAAEELILKTRLNQEEGTIK